MTALEEIRSAAVPRDPAMCRRYASLVEPWIGFVAYGALWSFVSLGGLTGGLMGSLWLMDKLHLIRRHQTAAGWVSGAASLLGGALVWWPYVRWVKQKRQRAARLFEIGILTEGSFATSAGDTASSVGLMLLTASNISMTHVRFTHEGAAYALACSFPLSVRDGGAATVLFHPELPLGICFTGGSSAVGTLERS